MLGQIGESGAVAPHLHFAIRPAGRGAPSIDPKPILDGWKLLESTAIYRAAGEDPFNGDDVSVGQVLLMNKTSSSAACSPTRASRSTPAGAPTSSPDRSTAASSP